MNKRATILSILLVLLAVTVLPGSQPAKAASTPTWTSIIHYFNPNKDPNPLPPGYKGEELNVIFFNNLEGGQPYDLGNNLIKLRQYQSGKLLVGKVVNQADFEGGAVISATVPIVAVYKQTVEGASPWAPILYTSFDNNQAGLGKYYLPAVQRTTTFDTQIGVQNIESQTIKVTLNFYDTDGNLVAAPTHDIDKQESYVFRVSDHMDLEFNGSLVINAVFKDQPSELAKIIAAAQDIQGGGRRAYAYEGMKTGALDLYLPAAACEYGATKQNTIFDVQNSGATAADIQLTYYDENGNQVAVYDPVNTIPVGAKMAIDTCDPAIYDQVVGKNLVALVKANTSSIAAVGRLSGNDGLLTGFVGQVAPTTPDPSDGKYRVLLPYVEWNARSTGYRTYITVMNASNGPIANVKAIYYRADGKIARTHVLGSVSKPLAFHGFRMTNPSAARAVPRGNRGYIGAVIVESDAPVVVLARVVRKTNIRGYRTLGDDYNGIPFSETP